MSRIKAALCVALAAGCVAFAVSVSKRAFGTYPFSPTTEDAIAICALGIFAYFLSKKDDL